MKMVVWKVTDKWLPTKYGVTGGLTLKVALKCVEGKDHKYANKQFNLNINSNQPNKQTWLNILQEGNIIDVQLSQMHGKIFVNKFVTGSLIRKAAM